jgi:hypothetical protein
MSDLTAEERQSIEMACSYEKTVVGPAAYHQCVDKQLSALTNVRRPNLSDLTTEERQSIEMACSYEKTVVGPAAYYKCVDKQLSALTNVRRPNLSNLTPEERQSIEMACSYEKTVVGPAAYHQCVDKQLSALTNVRRPNLSNLTSEERRSIEMACSYEKTVVGPAAYYRCVDGRVGALASSLNSTGAVPDTEANSQTGSTPVQLSKTSPEIKRLQYFVGTWKLAGDLKTSVLGPGGKFTGIQHNEWAADGRTVSSKWEEQRPTGRSNGQATYSYDSTQHVYRYHGSSDDGEVEDSAGSIEGNNWVWTSNLLTPSGAPAKGRFTLEVTSPSTYSFRFEIASQGDTWITVMEGSAEQSR